MVHLIPFNDTLPPCQSTDAYHALRPDPTSSYIAFQIGVGAVGALLYVILLPVLFYLRDEPRFYKVRPFYMFVAYGIGSSFYAIVSMLPEAGYTLPCWFFLFVHVLGSVCIMSLMFARSFVLLIETQYQVLLGKLGTLMDADDSTVHDNESFLGFRHALIDVVRLGFILSYKDEITPSRLGNLKQRQMSIILAVTLFPIFIFGIVVACIPVLRAGCDNCILFAEFVAVVLVTPSVIFIMDLHFIYLALQSSTDEQEVGKELRFICIFCAPLVFIGFLVFYLADVNDMYVRREFNPQVVIVLIANNVMWVIFELVQVIRALQAKHSRKLQKELRATSSSLDFRIVLNANEDLKKEFYKFAARRFVMESLNFLDDTDKYEKSIVNGKSQKWIRSKAVGIINTYIKENSPQEVNISDKVRNGVLEKDLAVLSDSELTQLFYPAVGEILYMLFSGPWHDFQHSLKMQETKVQPAYE